MSFSKLRMTAAAITVVALGVVGVAITASSASGAPAPKSVAQGAPAPTPPNANQPAPGAVSPHFQVAGRTSEMQYVPVAPCKLVDTRGAGGRFGNGTTRAFHARGTGSLAGQGGSSTGCGLPANAAAMNVSVSAITPSGVGFIRLNASDVADTGITSVQYVTNQGITAAASVSLSAPGTATAFKVNNTGGPTDIQVAVVGYYIAPMGADVNAAGNLVIGSRVTLAQQLTGFPGQYEVDFDRDVTKCYYSATSSTTNLTARVEPRSGVPNGVFVNFRNTAGVITATPFYLTVIC